jgi:glycerol-3-phosphate acyltransferase PlsY
MTARTRRPATTPHPQKNNGGKNIMHVYDFWWQLILLSLCSYLIGNISFATLLSRFFKQKDIRELGSGNPGTMNMLRQYGAWFGVTTLTLDVVKGALPAFLGRLLFTRLGNAPQLLLGDIALYLAGLSVILGHIYPIFFKFKGGKGAASTLGIFFVANPLLMLLVFVFALLYLLFFEIGSVVSFICIITLTVERGIYYNNNEYFLQTGGNIFLSVTLFALVFVTMYAHRQNITRLIIDREHKTSLKKILKIKEKQRRYIK